MSTSVPLQLTLPELSLSLIKADDNVLNWIPTDIFFLVHDISLTFGYRTKTRIHINDTVRHSYKSSSNTFNKRGTVTKRVRVNGVHTDTMVRCSPINTSTGTLFAHKPLLASRRLVLSISCFFNKN